MKPIPLFFFVFLQMSLNIFGQEPAHLKENAIKIDNPDSLGNDIYKAISKYQLIMIGEMYGTNEPVQFVMGLANLFVRKGYHAQIGLGIPSDRMKKYLSNPIDSNILRSDFFTKNPIDGRANFAIVNLIAKLNNNPNIEVFFYDVNPGDIKKLSDRDSLMYLKIKKRILLHPTWKTITLSGNIHNMLLPYEEKVKMALYLWNDHDLNISNKILSIDHKYATGTSWVDADTGMQLQQMDYSNSAFSKEVNYNNYLFLYPRDSKTRYTGIYFTRKTTAAVLVRKQ